MHEIPSTNKIYCTNIPQRWIIVLLCFLGSFSAFFTRMSFSIAMTEMVALPDIKSENSSNTSAYENGEEYENWKNKTIDIEKYTWSEPTQGLILSSFYWGYVITNILGGTIATKFGSTYILSFSVASTSVLTIVTPTTIKWGGSIGLILLRVLMGLGEGSMYPAINFLLSRWIPKTERSRATLLSFSGNTVGTIVGFSVSGVILRHSGWHEVFYVFGCSGLISFFLIYGFCYDQPSDSPSISAAELTYLREVIEIRHSALPPVPWRYIVRSKPVWAFLAAMNGKSWGLLLITSDMPKYLSSVLKLPPDENGFYNSIASVSSFICSCVVSWIADRLIIKRLVSTVYVRKFLTTLALFVSGIFIVAIPYAGYDVTLAISLYTISWTLFGFCNFSVMANALDLAPNYSGTLYGAVYGAALVSGCLSPYLVGLLTPNQSFSEWQIVFWILLTIYTVSNALFLIYGSADVQDWNDPAYLNVNGQRKKSRIYYSRFQVAMQ